MINLIKTEEPFKESYPRFVPIVSSITIFAGRFGEVVKWWNNLFPSELIRNGKAEATIRFENFDFEIKIRYLPNFELGIREKLGFAEINFEIESIGSLMILYNGLGEKGNIPFRCTKENGYIVYRYQDPDGNRVGLKTKYKTEDKRESIELDPIEFDALWKNGSTESELWEKEAGSNPNFKVSWEEK